MLTNLLVASLLTLAAPSSSPEIVEGIQGYVPTPEVLESRQRFSDDKFGIFIHWGVYSMLGRGEWVMNTDKIRFSDYSILPGGFYPGNFDAAAVWRQNAAAGFDGRRLACTVVPDEAADFARSNVKRQIVDGGFPAEGFGQMADGEHSSRPFRLRSFPIRRIRAGVVPVS